MSDPEHRKRIALVAEVILLCVMLAALVAFASRFIMPPGDEPVGVPSANLPRMELEFTKMDEKLEYTFDGVGQGEAKGYVIVRNHTGEAADFVATFELKDSGGQVIKTNVDRFAWVAPGDSALVFCTGPDDVARVDYEVRCNRSSENHLPLAGAVGVELADATDDQLELALQNRSDDTASVKGLRVECVGDNNVRCVGRVSSRNSLAPGERCQVLLQKDDMFGPLGLAVVAKGKLTFFVEGFAEPKPQAGATNVGRDDSVTPGTAERVPSERLTITKQGESHAGHFDTVGPRFVQGYVLVQNASDSAIALEATFVCHDGSGNKTSDDKDDIEALAPGATAMLRARSVDGKAASMDYEVRSAAPQDWATPLPDTVRVEEVSATSEALKVRISNADSRRVFVSAIRCVSTDANGVAHAAEVLGAGDIGPGESKDVLFNDYALFDQESFGSWEDGERTYYVSGHVAPDA